MDNLEKEKRKADINTQKMENNKEKSEVQLVKKGDVKNG